MRGPSSFARGPTRRCACRNLSPCRPAPPAAARCGVRAQSGGAQSARRAREEGAVEAKELRARAAEAAGARLGALEKESRKLQV